MLNFVAASKAILTRFLGVLIEAVEYKDPRANSCPAPSAATSPASQLKKKPLRRQYLKFGTGKASK